MKICFYNVTASFLQGGLETYCWEAGHALAQRGHDVTIVAGVGGTQRYSDVNLIRFPFIAQDNWPDFGTRFRRLMERCSFARHALPHLIEAQYDAIIINKPFDFPVLWHGKRKGVTAQIVYRAGGTEFYIADRFFSKVVDHWVSTSRYNANQVEGRYGKPVSVIHNGVDTSLFKPDQHLTDFTVSNQPLLLASVGRLVGWKGHRVIIEALKNIPDVNYLIIGDGPEKNRLLDQAKSLSIEDRIRFAGNVEHNLLPQFLQQADIFVHPSIGEEAFGISLVEAMACGLPVLASRNGGIPEIVVDGTTGSLLTPGDIAAWATAIEHLSKNRDKLKVMAVAARQRAVEEFTWIANAKKLEQKLLTGKEGKGI